MSLGFRDFLRISSLGPECRGASQGMLACLLAVRAAEPLGPRFSRVLENQTEENIESNMETSL